MNKLSREDLIKHWLLNTTINFGCSLLHILPTVRGISLNAKPVPRCIPEDYAKALRELYVSGHIQFSSEDSRDDVQSVEGVNRILSRFLGYSIEPPEGRYARGERTIPPSAQTPKVPIVRFDLTSSGGALWESAAEPDWNHFYDELSDYETGEAVSPDLTLLMARLGWFPELHSDRTIEIDSIEIEELRDFPILYWKRLPHVYRATFKCRKSEPRWRSRPNYSFRPAPAWFETWWPTTVSFYTEPWHLPSWPTE